jgi:ABC-type branched-subunit amino acid transport system substrate-binding protein
MLKNANIEWAKQMESSIHFQAFQVIQQAIEKAGSLDPEPLNRVLHDTTFPTLAGEIVHHEHGLGNSRSYPVQVLGGEFKLIWPKELATAGHLYPSVK